MRYRDLLGPEGGVISAHGAVLDRRGYVWFGKMGHRVSSDRVRDLRAQIARDGRAFLILAKASRSAVVLHRCEVDEIQVQAPDEPGTTPAYYSQLKTTPSTWFRIRGIRSLDASAADALTVASSGKPLFRALTKGMSPYDFVTESMDNRKDAADEVATPGY